MLLSDLRYGVRTLRRAPVFTGAAVMTMALTIGANTAIFSVVNAVMLRPLPFAEPGRLILSEGMVAGLAGIAAGLAGAYALSRALVALLFGVEARDPLTFGAVAAMLMATALAACLVPAWRGSRIDPIVALREE
jgi:phage shock protein PspC (stress-responsive transcriptional regulator)